MPKTKQRVSRFTSENRVRLIYTVGDVLERPRSSSLGGWEGGEAYYILDEILRRHLGKLELVPNQGVGYDSINAFIQVAPDEQLLDLIEFIPLTKLAHYEKHKNIRPYPNFPKIHERLNTFLLMIGSNAKFDEKGAFHRDEFEITESGPLSELPGKEDLTVDVEEGLKSAEPLSLIFIDLDNFKAVNERFGHPEGNKCLAALVDLLGGVTARRGRLYRYGGDEFAILLRNATSPESSATAERVRKLVEDKQLYPDIKLTASIGVACSDANDRSLPEKLIEAADEAMFVSKYTGKNRVTAWPPSPQDSEAARLKRREAPGR